MSHTMAQTPTVTLDLKHWLAKPLDRWIQLMKKPETYFTTCPTEQPKQRGRAKARQNISNAINTTGRISLPGPPRLPPLENFDPTLDIFVDDLRYHSPVRQADSSAHQGKLLFTRDVNFMEDSQTLCASDGYDSPRFSIGGETAVDDLYLDDTLKLDKESQGPMTPGGMDEIPNGIHTLALDECLEMDIHSGPKLPSNFNSIDREEDPPYEESCQPKYMEEELDITEAFEPQQKFQLPLRTFYFETSRRSPTTQRTAEAPNHQAKPPYSTRHHRRIGSVWLPRPDNYRFLRSNHSYNYQVA